MERFMTQYEDYIIGIISGFDRVLFRGTLRAINYPAGMGKFLGIQGILYKDYAKYAQSLSEELKAYAKKVAQEQGRPFIYLSSAKRSKEEKVKEIMKQDDIKEGLICVLTCVEPCQTMSVKKDAQTQKLKAVNENRQCIFIYYYYMDREFGLMHIRLESWIPFTIQICMNGREYLAKQMDKKGIVYEKRDNTFSSIANVEKAQKLMNKFAERNLGNVFNAMARRVNPLIKSKGSIKLNYYWSIRQAEYATDVMFKDADSLQAVYPALVRHAIDQFGSKDIMRFLGRKTNARFNGEATSSLQHRFEGIRVKHYLEENSIKMYDKQGSVLRVETTINNPWRFKVRRQAKRKGENVMVWLPMRKGIADIGRLVEVSLAANKRYYEALAVVGHPKPSRQLLDSVSKRVEDKGRVYRALQPISQADGELFRAVLKGEFALQGFRNKDIRILLASNRKLQPTPSRVTRWLALLAAHDLIYKVYRTNYYRISKRGNEIMNTAVKFRDSDIALLAA